VGKFGPMPVYDRWPNLQAATLKIGITMKHSVIEDSELANQLAALNHGLENSWAVENGRLVKSFKFDNFIEAMGFMTKAAIAAEKANHHPEWSNVYNRVDIVLVTHDSSGITQLDFDLAKEMEKFAQNSSS